MSTRKQIRIKNHKKLIVDIPKPVKKEPIPPPPPPPPPTPTYGQIEVVCEFDDPKKWLLVTDDQEWERITFNKLSGHLTRPQRWFIEALEPGHYQIDTSANGSGLEELQIRINGTQQWICGAKGLLIGGFMTELKKGDRVEAWVKGNAPRVARAFLKMFLVK